MSFEPDSDDLHAYYDEDIDDNTESISGSTDPNWDEIMYHDELNDTGVSLDSSDVVALSIAAVETIFLPLVILMVFLVALGFLLSVIF
ncbi:MAG: hypothetical protein ACTSYL_00385 [Candidatus Thorarchaeota archaeon]